MRSKKWYDYLWIWTIGYFVLGFFNILFAWLGMIDFLLPLFIAIFGGNKFFCNHLCGRGQLFTVIPKALKCSRQKPAPSWLSSKWFRYGFLIFFLTMFGNIILFKGDERISIKSFEETLIKEYGSIDVYDLITEMEEVYGCRIPDRLDVIYKVDGTDVYHDKYLDRLYANKDIFNQEVDEMEGL